jgi:hypothetical protein
MYRSAMRRLTLISVFAILLATSAHGAITFDFKGEVSGNPDVHPDLGPPAGLGSGCS